MPLMRLDKKHSLYLFLPFINYYLRNGEENPYNNSSGGDITIVSAPPSTVMNLAHFSVLYLRYMASASDLIS